MYRFFAGEHCDTTESLAAIFAASANAGFYMDKTGLQGVYLDPGDTAGAQATVTANVLPNGRDYVVNAFLDRCSAFNYEGFLRDANGYGGNGFIGLLLLDESNKVLAQIALKGEHYGTRGIFELSITGGQTVYFDKAVQPVGTSSWTGFFDMTMIVSYKKKKILAFGNNSNHFSCSAVGDSGWDNAYISPKLNRINAPVGHSSWYSADGTFNHPSESVWLDFPNIDQVSKIRVCCQAASTTDANPEHQPAAGKRRVSCLCSSLVAAPLDSCAGVLGDSITGRLRSGFVTRPVSAGCALIPLGRSAGKLNSPVIGHQLPFWLTIFNTMVLYCGTNDTADAGAAGEKAEALLNDAANKKKNVIVCTAHMDENTAGNVSATQTINYALRKAAAKHGFSIVDMAQKLYPANYLSMQAGDSGAFLGVGGGLRPNGYMSGALDTDNVPLGGDLFAENNTHNDFTRWTGVVDDWGGSALTTAAQIGLEGLFSIRMNTPTGAANRAYCFYNIDRNAGLDFSFTTLFIFDYPNSYIAGTDVFEIMRIASGTGTAFTDRAVVASLVLKCISGQFWIYGKNSAGTETAVRQILPGRRYRLEIARTTANAIKYRVGEGVDFQVIDPLTNANAITGIAIGKLDSSVLTGNYFFSKIWASSIIHAWPDRIHPGYRYGNDLAEMITSAVSASVRRKIRRIPVGILG